MSGKKSRDKGIRGEQEVARMFRRWFPDARRSYGQARKGYDQPDIIGGVEKHFFVEVKRYKRLTVGQLRKHWDKTVEDRQLYIDSNDLGEYDAHALMVYKEDRGVWTVYSVMDPMTTLNMPWSEWSIVMNGLYPIKENEE